MEDSMGMNSGIWKALHALCVGAGGDCEGTALGSQQLLEQPQNFSLNNASEGSEEILYAFSSSEEASAFREDMMQRGCNTHVEQKLMATPIVDVRVSGSLQQNMRKVDAFDGTDQSNVLCMMKCLCIPTKSFQISKHNMRFCKSAVASVQQVKDLSGASKFCRMYGSHVSQSLYHLGGVLFEEIAFSCAQTTSFKKLLLEGAKAMIASAGAASSSFTVGGGATMTGSRNRSKSNATGSSTASTLNQSLKRVTAWGPTNARDEDEFRRKLDEGISSWTIIKKGADTVDDLVAVWEILLQERQYIAEGDPSKKILETAAVLLRKAWLKKARTSTCSPNSLLKALLEREERNRDRFNQQLQLYDADEETAEDLEEVIPLAQVNKWVSPDVELPQRLQKIVEYAAVSPSLDLSPAVDTLLRSCIAHLKSAPQFRNLLKRTVSVIREYGFDEDGNGQYSMEVKHLQGMIEDIMNKVPNTTQEEITVGNPPHPTSGLSNWEAAKILSLKSTAAGSHLHTPPAFTYIGDVLADKPMMDQKQAQSAHARQQMLLDRLRHSLDPFQRPIGVQSRPKWSQNPSPANLQQETSICVFEDLLQIMKDSDLAAQVAICRFLLRQRAAVPLAAVLATQPQAQHDLLPLTHWVEALSFVEVKLLEEKLCYISEDLMLPRVVFLSDLKVKNSRAARVASAVVRCNFPSQHMNRQGHTSIITPAVEVGVGFVDSKPCLAFLVEGSYHDQLIGFVRAVADVIVLEQANADGKGSWISFPGKRMVRWRMDVDDGYLEASNEIWGTEGYLVEMITDYLQYQLMGDHELQQEVMDARRAILKDLCVSHFHPKELISFQCMQETLDKCDLREVRRGLCLQNSFAKPEASSFFDKLRLNDNPGERRLREKECDDQKELRRRNSYYVARNPLLQLFHMVLCQRDATERRVGLMWLQRFMAQRIQGEKQDLGVVNLWRELCHIFVASPGTQRDVAKLAAQHLLDGFPLEILDGDASMYCQPWVDTVMSELEVLTTNELKRTARLFVLSAMGLQSSGKSTILNLMFGAQLMASAGRCTRGVFIQLVPSQRPEFDYVLILDTEGIRSPDFHGNELANVRDNRLAAFGLLPADASIFMISNEDDSGLKEVLPMVLLGFKGSVIAEESGGKIRAKMFFVYRSVDTNDKEKLNANKEKLWRHLVEASKDVAIMGRSSDAYIEDKQLLQNMFQELHVDEDEEKSDVRCMGNLKKGNKPPEDVPDWEYGKQVMELREHINKRVLEGGRWRSVGIRKWTENLGSVWTCICNADFELSFKTAVECSSYAELQYELGKGPRSKVNTRYYTEFITIEKELRELSEGNAQKPHMTHLFTELQKAVQPEVDMQTKVVQEEILAKKRWSKWKLEESKNWEIHCSRLKDSYKSRIKDMCEGVFEFDVACRRYEMKMKKEIVAMAKENLLPASPEERDDAFNDLFQRILSAAGLSHPPQAQYVARNVVAAYTRTGIAAAVDLNTGDTGIDLNAASHNLVQHMKGALTTNKVKPEEALLKKLKDCIDLSLTKVTLYSEDIAERVICEADKLIIDAGCSRNVRTQCHAYVKSKLTSDFTQIQKEWDKKHNITAKLEVAKEGLRKFYENCADGIGATNMLISELEQLLRDELRSRHHGILVCLVADTFSRSEVVQDWRKLRACLDLHLLTLIGNRDAPQLLEFVANGSKHYEAVTDILIRRQIEENYEEQQKGYLSIVQRSLRDAANAAEDAQKESVESFLYTLKITLEDHLRSYEKNSSWLPLGQFLCSRVSREAYEGAILDSELYGKCMTELCEGLMMSLGCGGATALREEPGLMEELVRGVRKTIEMGHDELGLGPRCTQKCPMCGILCMHAAGHLSYWKYDVRLNQI